MLVVDCTYEFMNDIFPPYVYYWTYDRWMFDFAKSDTVFKGNVNDV